MSEKYKRSCHMHVLDQSGYTDIQFSCDIKTMNLDILSLLRIPLHFICFVSFIVILL